MVPLSEPLEPRCLLAATLPDGFVETKFASGLNTPTTMAFAPDGRLFVGQQNGQVRVIKNGQLLPTPFITVNVDTFRERGLQSIAFDPDFEENGYIYLYHNRREDPTKNRLVRYTASAGNPDVADAASRAIILDNILSPTGFHNGGVMHFGRDGMLYLGIGDGGSRAADAQVLSSLNGKVLRLDVSNYPSSIIPADNPYVNTLNARGEVYAIGIRNPYTGAIDPVTGKFFLNDVGFDQWEEINDIRPGRNYGWPETEGNTSNPNHTDPFHTYSHNGGSAAVTGGVFYRGNQFPAEFRGRYFFSDYTANFIKILNPDNGNVTSFATGATRPVDLDVGPDGSLYYLSIFSDDFNPADRPVMKISYVGSGNRAPTAEASSNVTSGRSPLAVNFDASGSSDPDGDALTYTWNFDDGSSATGRNANHTFSANGTYDVLLTVRDPDGATDTDTLRITVGNRAPNASISLSAGTYRAGDTISFTGTADDPDEGNLPAGRYEWRVVFHHRDHTHPFIDSIADVKTGQLTIPITGEPDPAQFYRVHLTVTDSDGLTSTKFVDVAPRTSTITLSTSVPGLKLNLDGTPQSNPTSLLAVEGMRRTLAAPATQTLKGRSYQFVSWSDKGKAEHNILVPTSDAAYTAVYREIKPVKHGLTGAYFDNRDFTGKSVTRIDSRVNFKWAKGSPANGIGANSFSVRWTGQIQVPKSGKWTFHTLSDDGVRLFINGKPIINHFVKQRAAEHAGSIKLQAGKKYDLRMDYFDANGEALAQLRWSGPKTRKQIIPTPWLFAK